jgi:tetratricopeptide (TPR) repeat protein
MTPVNLDNLAALYYARGNVKAAEWRYRRELAIKEKLLGGDNPDVAMTLNNLAVLRKVQQRYFEAASLYRRALTIFERELGHEHPKVKTCRANYEKLLREMGQ